MDIHKPKPWHGLREFLKEYVIIVVGVLTALGAEQTAEWLHWRHAISATRVAIILDQRHLMQEVGATDVASACTARRLSELRVALGSADRTGRLQMVPTLGPPPSMPWLMSSWDTVVSGGALPHFPHELARVLSSQAFVLNELRNHRDGVATEWAALTMLTGAERPISPMEVAWARASLGRALGHAARVRTTADALGQQIISADLIDRSEVAAEWKKGAEDYANSRAPNVCQQIAPTAPSFNEGILAAPAHAPAHAYDFSSVRPKVR